MTLSLLVAYSVALLLACATLGPAMFAVISTGISRGISAALGFVLGVAIGVLVSVALAGLVAIAQSFAWVFNVIKFAGAAYLMYLGYRMWKSAGKSQELSEPEPVSPIRQIAVGAAVGLGNPKAILFCASLMPLILNVATLTAADIAIVLAVVFSVNVTVMGIYAILASASSSWFRSTKAIRILNKTADGAMIATGVLVAVRS
ncbi:LysE family translocator [Rhizobium leguminosarum]|uniref:LysE family translocator n=1 Tax=Rhizobium leguminosarum TaxID=384 RepID=UPI0010310951|nr:LysE family translocator [Rhizobium leguminosarum]TAV50218.1 LysE family translocator [Rhizobium leguminosarum]TAV59581.1 LysE family translocator [Rhizobium leguminosarum]TAV70628.1 LysE family translocator [Rhizobium leguminosarum]TAY68245.1 LysE family translocator [Rhizobium leguminosarum]